MKSFILIPFALMIFSSFLSDRIIKTTGFLFILDGAKEEFFFIESKDSILAPNVFLNDSYRIFERLCTRSPNIYEFVNQKFGEEINFDYITVYGDTSQKTLVRFIFCELELRTFEKRRRVKEKITGRFKDNYIKTISFYFNNQIEYLMPIKQKDLTLFLEELKNKYK